MNSLAKNIKSIRTARKMSQDTLAQKTGYKGKSMISRIENGTSLPPYNRVLLIAEALEVTPEELYGWSPSSSPEEKPLEGKAIPVYSKWISSDPEKQLDYIVSYEQIPASRKGSFFALQISDKSLSPVFSKGDIVIIQRQEKARNREIVIVQSGTKPGVFYKYRKTKTGEFLLPLNDDVSSTQLKESTSYSSDFSIIGVVVETRRKYIRS